MFKNKKIVTPAIILIVLIFVSLTYTIISFKYLVPYFNEFRSGGYIIQPNDLPNFADVFNSIFIVINCLVTSILSYAIFQVNSQAVEKSYHTDIVGPTVLLYFNLKMSVMKSICVYLLSQEGLIKENYIAKKGGASEDCIKRIELLSSMPIEEESLDKFLPSIIGMIKDSNLKMKLYVMSSDLKNSYKEETMDTRFIYTVPKELINGKKLIETSSKKWVYILDRMYDDDWSDLTNDYSEIMKTLYNITQNK